MSAHRPSGYLPFPGTNDHHTNHKALPQKRGSKISVKKVLQNASKKNIVHTANSSENHIKYNIDDNKSKSNFNQIINHKLSKSSVAKHKHKKPSSSSPANRPNADTKWICGVCTYKNLSIMAYCEICDTKKENNNAAVDDDGDIQLEYDLTQNNDNDSFQIHCSTKRTYSKDEEIARKLQEELNESMELQKVTKRQRELEDAYLAKKLQSDLEEKEREKQQQKHEEDAQLAKKLQQEHEAELFKFVKQNAENEQAAIDLQADEDLQYAKYFEKKQKEDEVRSRDDESFAIKMQQELNKGAAWFCNVCFAMNMNIKQLQCNVCDTKRAKPKIPKYIMQLRDDLSSHILNAIRECPESIVNITFVRNFVVKYFKMCEEIGTVLAYPKIVYHWTKSDNFDPIAKGGLQVPDGEQIAHQTDTGFYGKGIYTSPDPVYAQGYGHGANKLFVCLSLPGRQYKASYPQSLGKPLMEGYDSHVSKDRNEMEWVYFHSDQLLLCYLVTLDFLEAEAKIQMNYVCQFLESKFVAMREEKLNKLTKDDV